MGRELDSTWFPLHILAPVVSVEFLDDNKCWLFGILQCAFSFFFESLALRQSTALPIDSIAGIIFQKWFAGRRAIRRRVRELVERWMLLDGGG